MIVTMVATINKRDVFIRSVAYEVDKRYGNNLLTNID